MANQNTDIFITFFTSVIRSWPFIGSLPSFLYFLFTFITLPILGITSPRWRALAKNISKSFYHLVSLPLFLYFLFAFKTTYPSSNFFLSKYIRYIVNIKFIIITFSYLSCARIWFWNNYFGKIIVKFLHQIVYGHLIIKKYNMSIVTRTTNFFFIVGKFHLHVCTTQTCKFFLHKKFW